MKKITIGFSTPKNKKLPLFSWIIKAYEGTPFSHVYIRWQTKYGSWLCYHAASTVIHFQGEHAFNEHIKPVEEFEFEISNEDFDKLMEFCIKYAGADYAIWEVLSIPLWDAGIVTNDSNDPWSQYCAELICRALASFGSMDLTQSPDRVKLKEVYSFVKKKHASGATL